MTASILVIDDQPEVRDALAEVLRSVGYQVDTAIDGADGIKVIGLRGYDLIVTDILMPNRDGLEVLAAARKICPGIAVIAVSDPHFPGGDLDLLRLATRLGADRALPKPVAPDKLLVAAAELLEACQRRRRFQ
jgi:CheY-like chemotaxis protein